jgi:hypothetical protein
LRYLWLGARRPQQYKDQPVRRARRVRLEIRGRTRIVAARKTRSGPRKQGERKIKELRTPELGIAMIRVARTGSMWLKRLMEDRAASETEVLSESFGT